MLHPHYFLPKNNVFNSSFLHIIFHYYYYYFLGSYNIPLVNQKDKVVYFEIQLGNLYYIEI